MTAQASRTIPRPRVMPPLPLWLPRAEAILSEVDEPTLAAELWIQLRHLGDWLMPSGTRSELFHPAPSERVKARRALALAAASEAACEIGVFHALTDSSITNAEQIAVACINVSDWAMRLGYAKTAVEFSAAGAHAGPESPMCLNAAGLMHRRGGEWASAELYYQRAAYFAYHAKNADERVSAHIGLAALWFGRDQYRRARRHLDRATNIARRNGSTWLAAHAQHDLMLMLTERGEYLQAEAAASRAVGLYPLNDPRFPFFAADFAFLQISEGLYDEAVPTLELFLKLIDQPAQQVIGLSLLARAYAGSGRDSDFLRVREGVTHLLAVYEQDAAAALYHLAEAARSRGDWDEAAASAAGSRKIAVTRGEKAVARYAESLLDAISQRQDAVRIATADPSGKRRVTANTLSVRLRRWTPSSRRGRPRQPRRNHWTFP